MSFKRYNISLNRIFVALICIDSYFLVSVSLMIDIGKEISLPGFRNFLIIIAFERAMSMFNLQKNQYLARQIF